MPAPYAIINTDLMSATDDRARMRSFRYGTVDGTTKKFTQAEIQNGSIVTLTELYNDERDEWIAVDAAANTPLHELVVVASPEVLYDENHQHLNEFVNNAEVPATGMILKEGDIFSVTAEALEGDPKKGAFVASVAGTKMKVQAAAPGAGTTKIGKIIDVWVHNRTTFYAIRVG